MQSLTFAGGLKKILLLGAHCDDIEIGCGGAVLRLVEENPQAEFLWVVFASNPIRKSEALACAEAFLQGAAKHEIVIHAYRDGFLPNHWAEVKDDFEAIKKRFNPDLILTHCRQDLHQDHRIVSDLTWNTWRDHLILEYEIPKYDGDMGIPNFFVRLDQAKCDAKIAYLMKHYATQAGKQWFMEDTFRALLRLRGMEANSPTRYAEAFFGRKTCW